LKKKLIFLINPASGIKGNTARFYNIIHKCIDSARFDYEINTTQYAGHGKELSRKAVQEGADAVIVCGGDGTVNEAASELVNSEVALGIIPRGSGNGFANFLGISKKPQKAMDTINDFVLQKADTFTLNGKFGCNLAGIGFDASVAEDFSRQKRRGFFTYLKVILKKYPGYKPHDFHLKYDGIHLKRKALLVTFANSNQFGNGAVIAPGAKINDGLLDVCILQKTPLLRSLSMGYKLLRGTIDRSSFVEYIKTNRMSVSCHQEVMAHIDGDPYMAGRQFAINISSSSLVVIVPQIFKSQ